MPDVFNKKKRSEVMALIHSKNTKPELALRALISRNLYSAGYRYRIHYKNAPGKPDVAFVAQKVAVFVDGSFWHGYNFNVMKERLPKSYWLPKITRNIEKDGIVNRELRRLGWKTIRIWDHELQKNPDKVLRKILAALKSRSID